MIRLFAITQRDLRTAIRQGSATLMVVMFFVLTVTLFPFGVGPEPMLLSRMAPGILWVAALLAALLSLDRIFQADWEDGSLELLVLTGGTLEWVVLSKIFAHWLTTGLPLTIIAPFLAVWLNLDPAAYFAVSLSMLIGTPILSLIGAVGAALTVSLRRGGALLSLLILPLYIPVLIFGVSAIDAAAMGSSPDAALLILAAFLLASLALTPLATAAAIRLAAS